MVIDCFACETAAGRASERTGDARPMLRGSVLW
jgi:hypothetical protein